MHGRVEVEAMNLYLISLAQSLGYVVVNSALHGPSKEKRKIIITLQHKVYN